MYLVLKWHITWAGMLRSGQPKTTQPASLRDTAEQSYQCDGTTKTCSSVEKPFVTSGWAHVDTLTNNTARYTAFGESQRLIGSTCCRACSRQPLQSLVLVCAGHRIVGPGADCRPKRVCACDQGCGRHHALNQQYST